MADTIKLKAGNKAGMPDLADREPAYVRDEQALYIGTSAGNVKIGAQTEAKVNALEGRIEAQEGELAQVKESVAGKLTAAPAASLAALAADADAAAITAAYNALLEAMKAAGLMSN